MCAVHHFLLTSYVPPGHALYIPSICTLHVMSVISPIHGLFIQSIHTLCTTSVIPPVCASPILSIHVCMDLLPRSYWNGTQDLPVLSRVYGTLVNQATALDLVFLQI